PLRRGPGRRRRARGQPAEYRGARLRRAQGRPGAARLAAGAGVHDSFRGGHMNRQRTNRQRTSGRSRPMTIALGLAVVSVIAVGCSSGGGRASSSSTSGHASAPQNGGGAVAGATVPTANLPVPQKVGTGEGQLNLI